VLIASLECRVLVAAPVSVPERLQVWPSSVLIWHGDSTTASVSSSRDSEAWELAARLLLRRLVLILYRHLALRILGSTCLVRLLARWMGEYVLLHLRCCVLVSSIGSSIRVLILLIT